MVAGTTRIGSRRSGDTAQEQTSPQTRRRDLRRNRRQDLILRKPKDYHLRADAGAIKVKGTVKMTVTRGNESWTYIYVMMGFALSIEGTIVAMITPLAFPWNIATFAIAGVTTVYLFTSSGWFQNRLLGFKSWYESKGR